MLFLNNKHKANFKKLIEKDLTKETELQTRSMFFIIAGCSTLMASINSIYDFEGKIIDNECFDKNAIGVKSSGEQALLRFAFNLYNGYSDAADVYEVFSHLDFDGLRLCINALELKYMQKEVETKRIMEKMMKVAKEVK